MLGKSRTRRIRDPEGTRERLLQAAFQEVRRTGFRGAARGIAPLALTGDGQGGRRIGDRDGAAQVRPELVPAERERTRVRTAVLT